MSNRLIKLLATFFYVGEFPVAPGTLATLAGMFLAISLYSNKFLYALVFVIVTLIGFYVSGKIEKIVKEKDPSCVVIDEVSGSLIAFCALPLRFDVLIIAFFLFRAFDMFKIYPSNKLEELPGSAGIMTDDLVAGVYTFLTMQVALRLAGIY